MRLRTYKFTILILLFVIVWLGWRYWYASGQAMSAGFIHHQAENLRMVVRDADASIDGQLSVLHSLNWYITYYDSYTNRFEHSFLRGLLKSDREQAVGAAIEYLRKHSTNNWGDDPYTWIKNEY